MTSKYQVMESIFETGGVEIRDVDAGEPPFLYSSGNHGPGYVDIKGRVGFQYCFEGMVELLYETLMKHQIRWDVTVGMMTGGALPAFRLTQLVWDFNWDRSVLVTDPVYIYQRGSRKVDGHQELDTGVRNNPSVKEGSVCLIVEELVNFTQTTCNGAAYERSQNRIVTDAACILFYENPVAIERLKRNNIKLHYPLTLRELLDFGVSNKYLKEHLVVDYLRFLADPKGWNERHGYDFHSGE